MKRTNRLIAAVVASSLMLALSFVDASQADSTFPCSIEGSYSVINGVVTNASSCIGKVTIDSSATSIGIGAFLNNIGISEVILPPSVTAIGRSAFLMASNLKSITLTDSITTIPEYAFSQDWALSSISLPASITSIGSNAFSGDLHIAEILLPQNLNFIGDSAFAGMSALTNITIPMGVKSILPYTFAGSGLSLIKLPADIVSIDSTATYQLALNNIGWCGGYEVLSYAPFCPTPVAVTPSPSPSSNSSPNTPPTSIPSVSVRLEGEVLISQVNSPLSLLTSPEGITGISEGLKMGFIQISTKDSSYRLSTNGANVQFTWDLSSLWDAILKYGKPLDIYTYFVNQVGNGQLNHVSFSLPVSTVAPTFTQSAKKPIKVTKTIVCYKGKVQKKFTGSNPTCPKGFNVSKR